MKKMLSAIIVVFLLCVMSTSDFLYNAKAEGIEYTSGKYTYTISNGEATIVDISYHSGLLGSGGGSETIPLSFNGYPVTKIDIKDTNLYYASIDNVLFNKQMTSLIKYLPTKKDNSYKVPSTIVNINHSAFSKATCLEIVYIESPINTIAPSAFNGCTNLTDIVMSKTLYQIGSYAFSGCTSLNKIWFGGSEYDRNQLYIFNDNTPIKTAVWYYNVCASDLHEYLNQCDDSCENCDWSRIIEHTYDNACDTACNECGDVRTVQDHEFNDNHVCIHCNYVNYTPGDINDSGAEPDLDDVVALAQIVAGWQNVAHNAVALDVNGDTTVTLDDVVLLAQFVAGWAVELK